MAKLINRIPGLRLLISSLPGSALRTHVESLGKPRDVNKRSQRLDIKRYSPSILYISASLVMSTCVLKALPGKLDIKRYSPSILYISASLLMSTSVLKALPGKLDIKRYLPSILYISASLVMSTSVLKALPGKLDIKRHSPSILYLFFQFTMESVHMSNPGGGGGTLIFSHIRRLGPFFWVQNSEFQYFLGFSEK